MTKLYTLEEVARILKIHKDTVRKWLKGNRIKGQKIGRRWYLNQEQLDEMLQGVPDPRWDV